MSWIADRQKKYEKREREKLEQRKIKMERERQRGTEREGEIETEKNKDRQRERIQNFNVHRSFSVCCICYWHSLNTCTCSTFIWHSMGKVKLFWTAMFTWVRKVRKLMTPIPTINKVHINILSSCSDVLVMANVWNGGSSISNLTLQHVTFVDLINTYTEQWHRLIMKISFS